MDPIEEMAALLHDEQCTRNHCNYYLQQGREGAHRLYYWQQAQIIWERLERLLGGGDIIPVVRVILEELW